MCEARWHLRGIGLEMYVCDGHLVPVLLQATKPKHTELGAIITDAVSVKPYLQAI